MKEQTLIFFIILSIQSSFSQFQTVLTACGQCLYAEKCEQLLYGIVYHCVPGIKGNKCDALLLANDNVFLSSPCYNGGICRSNSLSEWTCDCPPGFIGKGCQAQAPTTTPPVLLTLPNGQLYNPNTNVLDKKVIIFNKGGYVASMTLSYMLRDTVPASLQIQRGSITLGQKFAFYIPVTVDYTVDPGVLLSVDAVGGFKIFEAKLTNNPECFDVWGTTLISFWSRVNC